MPEKTDAPARAPTPPWLIALIALLAVGVIWFVLASGEVLDKASIPGWLELDFSTRPAAPRPVASRDFMLGKWEVDQPNGTDTSGTTITYDRDGTLSGWAMLFVNGVGRREPWSGTWSFTRLSDDTFRLSAVIGGRPPILATFRIFDRDHIQNTDTNYVAVRIP